MARRAMIFWADTTKPPDTAVYDEDLKGWFVGWERFGPYTTEEVAHMGGTFQ